MILSLDDALSRINIPVAKFELADSLQKVERAQKKFGFPCVLKLVSPKVIHKTEEGGVKIIHDPSELRESANLFLKKGKVLVQEKCEGVELFLGIKNDPSFGHVLLAGIGGIFVEVYKDISFRVCPISKKDAEQMLDELKGKKLLEGIRGMKPVNRKALVDAMVSLSHLPKKIKGLEELDVNPLFANEKEVVAVDARIVLED
jgi:acyl-CoA synthetase (NDP forming)